MTEFWHKLHRDESGQDIIEYIVIAAVISVAGIALIPGIATKIQGYWNALSAALP